MLFMVSARVYLCGHCSSKPQGRVVASVLSAPIKKTWPLRVSMGHGQCAISLMKESHGLCAVICYEGSVASVPVLIRRCHSAASCQERR